MQKIFYISFSDFSHNSCDGVSKKVHSQLKAFANLGLKTDYTYIKDGAVYLNKDNKEYFLFKSTGVPYRDNNLLYKALLTNSKLMNYQENLIYIRNHRRNIPQFKFLKRMVEEQSNKIILEIPTYPYKGEKSPSLKGIKAQIGEYQDDILNFFLKKYITKIVTFSQHKMILGRPCICISNGIDLDKMTIINKIPTETITFTSVSICKSWHGIDRFLQSLAKFKLDYPQVDVKFNIIGEGSNTPKLKELVAKNADLASSVVFHGFKSGKELDELYNETDIAVGSLGIHRIGLTEVQPLKNREYAAKGLPFVISFRDPDFSGKEFVFQVASDESLIDIATIIAWYRSREFNPQNIHEYAKKFSWDTQMQKVIQEIN